MSTIVLVIPVSEVVVSEGRAVATASVTNTATVPARIVLSAFPPTGGDAGEARPVSWTTVERPLREIGAGATEQFTITFAPPVDLAGGRYPVRFIAYSADGAPEENSDQARQVDVVVPAVTTPPPPPPRRWWIYAVAAALVLVVGVVGFLVGRGGGTTPSPSPTDGETTTAPPAPIDGITWTLTGFEEGGAPVPLVPGTTVTLEVDGDRVSGSGGCNVYNGDWQQNGDQVTVGPLGTTLRLCFPSEVNEQERRFLQTLRQVTVIEATDPSLVLATAEGRRLTFGK